MLLHSMIQSARTVNVMHRRVAIGSAIAAKPCALWRLTPPPSPVAIVAVPTASDARARSGGLIALVAVR
jgi:hypothetical protein